MRHAILVLGMHRSGTSALAGALVHLGAAPPLTLMPPTQENERGYFKSLAFMEFHDTILAASQSRWNDWRRLSFPYGTSVETGYRDRAIALLNEEFADAPLFVLKDPRACRLVPFWLRTLRYAGIAPHVIIPVRPPLEVAESLAARDARMPLTEGVALWLRHALDAERDSRDAPRSFVFMDDLLGDWRGSLERIGRDLELAWPVGPAAAAGDLASFLSSGLKHHASAPGTALAAWAGEALAAFSELVGDPRSPSARSALDAIGTAFDRACDLFGAPDPSADDNAAALRQARFWALQAQAAELRGRLVGLRDRAALADRAQSGHP